MAEKEPNENPFPEAAIRIPAGAPITTIRVPNMPSVYVNNARLAVGAVDIRLFVGDQEPNEDGTGVTVTQRLCLVMTPEVAKVIAENFIRAMAQFEKEFGKLRDVGERTHAKKVKPAKCVDPIMDKK
jgi:hypothetical protein